MHTPSLLSFLLKFGTRQGGSDVRGLRESACGHNHAELQRKKSRCMRRHYLDDQLATENPDLEIGPDFLYCGGVLVVLRLLRHDTQLGSR